MGEGFLIELWWEGCFLVKWGIRELCLKGFF